MALYDGIKQGGLARYFDRDALAMYLVKKIYCHAYEGPLMTVAQLCVEEAVGSRMDRERAGIRTLRRKAYEEVLEQDFRSCRPRRWGISRRLCSGRSWTEPIMVQSSLPDGWRKFTGCVVRQRPWI